MRPVDADYVISKRKHAKDFDPEMYVIGQGFIMDAPTLDLTITELEKNTLLQLREENKRLVAENKKLKGDHIPCSYCNFVHTPMNEYPCATCPARRREI